MTERDARTDIGHALDAHGGEWNLPRLIIPLGEGEPQPFYPLGDVPEGYRLESDADYRDRLLAKMREASDRADMAGEVRR